MPSTLVSSLACCTGLARAPVGEGLAAGVGLRQLVALVPAAAVHQVVDVGAVGPVGVAEDPQGRGLQVAVVGRLIGQGVLAHEVLVQRLVRAGGLEGGLREQPGLQRQQVTEDAGQGHHHVDARPAQFLQGDQVGTGQAAEAIEARAGAHQGQGLGDGAALGLEVVRAPQDHGDALRQRIALDRIALQEPFGLTGAILQRKLTGDAVGVEAVEVAPGRQDLRGAQQVTAGGRPHIAAVQGVQDGRDLVLLGQQLIGLRRAAPGGSDWPRSWAWRRPPGRAPGSAPATRAAMASRGGRASWLASAMASSRSVRCSGVGTVPTMCSPSGNQGVFQFQHGLVQPGDGLLAGIAPGRLGGAEIEFGALGLNQLGQPLALVDLIGREAAAALDGALQVDQTRDRDRHGRWAVSGS